MKNYNIRLFYEWPIFAKLIVIGIGCLIVFYLAYFFDFSDTNAKLKRIKNQEEDLKAQMVPLLTNQVDLKNDLKKYPLFLQALSDSQKTMIEKKDLAELVNSIVKIGAKNGLVFSSFNPESEIKNNGYTEVPIKAALIGSYDQIATFFSQIANLDYLVAIGDFTLSKDIKNTNSNKAVKAEITLEIYERKNL